MSIPKNITKEHIEKAINEIISSEIPKERLSIDYFLKYGDKLLPPKYVISIANRYANNIELPRKDFITDEAQRYLKKYGFEIIIKKMEYFEQLKMFLEQAKTDDLTTKKYHKEFSNLTINVSFGQGNSARIPWISFLGKNQTTSNGIYPVYLYYKDKDLLILAFGVSENNTPTLNWNIKEPISIENYFSQENYGKPDRYGSSLLFKHYNVNDTLIENEINKDLNEIINIYKEKLSIQSISTNNQSKIEEFNHFLNYYLSIKTKPFIILAGLSGTGKSRLVRTLAYRFNNIDKENQPPTNFQLIKVKPNWHDSSELLGYESRISGKDRFIVTDFIRFIVKAWQYPDTPFFLCLDEMNLAPVEQYFAEYLSVIETRRVLEDGKIKTDALISSSLINKYAKISNNDENSYDLWSELELKDEKIQDELIENGLSLPLNLIVMGTVNMDETTHSFSRKVLDRAMTIEMNDIRLSEGLSETNNDWSYSENPLEKAHVLSVKTQGHEVYNDLGDTGNEIIDYLNSINIKLEGSPFKIAYRVRDEFLLFAYNYSLLENKPANWLTEVKDEMTLMKILPRIEGDEDRTRILDELINSFEQLGLSKSLKKANEMKKRRDEYHYTSFWS